MRLVITIRDIRNIPSAAVRTVRLMMASAVGVQGKKQCSAFKVLIALIMPSSLSGYAYFLCC